jgi:hypothetical protein
MQQVGSTFGHNYPHVCIRVIFKKASLIGRLLQLGRIRKFGFVLPLSRFYSSHNTKFKCSCFHDLDKFGDCAWFLTRL